MKPEIRIIGSPDVNDLRTYAPHDQGEVAIQVAVSIGTEGDPGADLFYFLVRTPEAIERELEQTADGYVSGRAFIVMKSYDYGLLRRALEKICEDAEGPDWDHIASRLSRYAYWEFEERQRNAPTSGFPE